MKRSSASRIILYCSAITLFWNSGCEDIYNQAIQMIETGTSFGECLGFCFVEMKIQRQTVNFRKYGYDKSRSYLEKSTEGIIEQEEWDKLIGLVNLHVFYSLDDVIGCPDCVDGGAEWIKITSDDSTKKVTFEYGNSIKGIEDFVVYLRTIRERFHEELFPTP